MNSSLQRFPFRALAQQDDCLAWQAETHSVESGLARLSQAVLDYFSDAVKALSDRLQARDLDNQFTFLATVLHFFSDHLSRPENSQLHKSDSGATIDLTTSEFPLAHVDAQAGEKPACEGLPHVDQVLDAATKQLAEHVDWLNEGDQFAFLDLHTLGRTLIDSALARVQAAVDQLPDGFPQFDLHSLADAAAEQFTGHLDWLKNDQLTFQISEAKHQGSSHSHWLHGSNDGAENGSAQLPLEGLGDRAVVDLASTVAAHIEDHVQALLQADQLAFSPSDPLQAVSVSSEPTLNEPSPDIQINHVPIETVEAMTLPTGVLGADDWMIS